MALFSRKPRFRPSIPTGERVYAIGDIHGRLDLYDRLIAQIAADDAGRGTAQTTVILLGDLIDRGPDSAGVVRRAMQPLGWADLRVLRGNHEAALLDALDGDPRMLDVWLRNGGVAALRSWGVDEDLVGRAPSAEIVAALAAAIPPAERAWIARTRLSIRIGDYYFVHAGIRPGIGLAEQSDEDALWIRAGFLESTRDHGVIVVHGHTIAEEIDERPNRIGIDTGAYASDRLSAIGLEGADRWFLRT